MKKIVMMLSAVAAAMMFTGCSSGGDSIKECLSSGYAGVIANKGSISPTLHCSDGKVINGKIRANGGLYPKYSNDIRLTTYMFLPFTVNASEAEQFRTPTKNANTGAININIDNSQNKSQVTTK